MLATSLSLVGLRLQSEYSFSSRASVYLADADGTSVLVLLEPTGQSSRANSRQLFLSYVSARARASHATLPPIETIEAQGPHPHAIMRHVTGEPLDRLFSATPDAAPAKILEALLQIAGAIESLHRNNCLHLQIRPNTVISRANDASVTLLDVALRDANPSNASQRYAEFVAPELLREDNYVFERRVDVFAFGRLVLHYVNLVEPSRSTWDSSQRRVANELVRLGQRCCEVDPENRYPHFGSITFDLQRIDTTVEFLTEAEIRLGSGDVLSHLQALHGRDAERYQLLQLWLRSAARGPSFVLLRGAQGSGKSALLQNIGTDLLIRSANTLIISRQPDDADALSFFRSVTKAYRTLTNTRDDLMSLPQAVDAIAGASQVLRQLHFFGHEQTEASASPYFQDGQIPAHAVLATLARVMALLFAQCNPIAILIDDIDLISDSARSLLRRALALCDDARVVVFGTVTQRENATETFVSHTLGEDISEITLPALAAPPLRQCLHDWLGHPLAQQTLAEELIELSSGSPGVLKELIDLAVDQEVIALRKGEWQAGPTGTRAFRLSQQAETRLRTRLAATSSSVLRILQDAAVLGLSFPVDLLHYVCNVEADQCRHALDEAAHRNLITTVDGPGEIAFVHATVYNSLLAESTAEQRAQIHQRAVQWANETLEDTITPQLGLTDLLVIRRARHASFASQHFDAAARFDYSSQALHHCLARNDYQGAQEFGTSCETIRRGEGVLAPAPYFLDIAALARYRNDLTLAADALQKALVTTKDIHEKAKTCCALAWVAADTANYARAAELLADAGQSLSNEIERSCGRWFLWSEAIRLRTWQLLPQGVGTRHYQRRVSMPPKIAGYLSTMVEILRLQIRVSVMLRNWPLVQHSARRAKLAAHLIQNDSAQIYANTSCAIAAVVAGDPPAAIRYYGQALRLAHRSDRSDLTATALQSIATGLIWAGQFNRAARIGEHYYRHYRYWIELSELAAVALSFMSIHFVEGDPGRAGVWAVRVAESIRERGGTEQIQAPERVHTMLRLAADINHLASDLVFSQGEHALIGPLAASIEGEIGYLPYFVAAYEYGTVSASVLDLADAYLALPVNSPKSGLQPIAGVVLAVCGLLLTHVLHRKQSARSRTQALRRIDLVIGRLAAYSKVPLFHAYQEILLLHVHVAMRDFRGASLRLPAVTELIRHCSAPGPHFELARVSAHVFAHEASALAAEAESLKARALAERVGAVRRLQWLDAELGSYGRSNTRPHFDHDWLALQQQGERRERQLYDLLELGRFVASEADPEFLARQSLALALRVLHADRVTLLIPSSDGVVEIFARYPTSGPLASSADADPQDLRFARALWQRPQLDYANERLADEDGRHRRAHGVVIRDQQVRVGVLSAIMRSTPSREQDGAHEELFAAVAQHLAHVCVRLVHASGRTARPYLAQAKSDSSLPASSVSSLLDNSLDGALLLDPATGTIQEINDITCRLVGWHPDAAVGTHYGKLFGPSSQDACEEAFLVALRNGSSHKPGESLCGPSDGRIPVDLHFRMIEHGGRKQMLLIVRDQRERERLQTQMRQAQKLEAIGRLAGGIAHDFNNILTVVSRATDSLEDPTTAEVERTSDLATIRHTIDRATQLTRQLLTFARQQSATPQPIDLRQVISETGRMLSRLVGEGIELDLILCDEESVVYLDRSEFEQLLLNLIVNARDAMEEAGAITIELRRILSANRQAFVELKVSDTGRGIPGDLLPRVFDPFFTTKEDGTGLGLATVYGIVTRAQGSVSVHSEEQAGTIFTVRLPAYEAASSSQSQAKLETIVAQEPSSDATGRILYVEDEENVRSMVARALSRMGHQVTPADNPTLALELFTRGDVAFDLLVTDVLMPGMSGPRMVREMRKLQPDLRVLYVSGYLGEAENLQQIANETHSNYLSKPFRLSDMRRLVAQLLADAFEHRTHALAETAHPTPLSLPTQTEHERSKH